MVIPKKRLNSPKFSTKNNSFGTGLVAFLVFVGLIGLIGMAVKEDDYSESYSSRSYGYSSGGTSTTSSRKKYNSTSSPSSTSSSSYSGTDKNYSSSSGSSRYRTQDSYVDGDEEVYDDFDYDIDRYYEDDEYADGGIALGKVFSIYQREVQ